MPKVLIFNSADDLPIPFVPGQRVSITRFLTPDRRVDEPALHEFIYQHMVIHGQPLVIGDFDTLSAWDYQLFAPSSLPRLFKKQAIEVYKMKSKAVSKSVMANFLRTIYDGKIPSSPNAPSKNQQKQEPSIRNGGPEESHHMNESDDGSSTMATDDEHEQKLKRPSQPVLNTKPPRIYAKDLSCPAEFKAGLGRLLPEYLLPFTATDLFSSIPPHLAAEHLMCYVGSTGTGTAMHRDLCSTLGHNIMTYADKGGFSEWIFIPKEQRDELLRVCRPSKKERQTMAPGAIDMGSEAVGVSRSSFLESDRAWLSQTTLRDSKIKTQVIIQRPGDLVLIPSMCYHQVRNVGTSVKVAWNRASARSLCLALENQLPIYRSIGRPELYRCKAMVYYSLCNWDKKIRSYLKSGDRRPDWPPWFREECEILCNTFLKQVIYPEMIDAIPSEDVSDEAIKINVSGMGMYTKSCNFCHADIFNRHYHCTVCQDYDLCLGCYSKGRGCVHMDRLTMFQGSTSLQVYIDVYASFIETMNEAFEKFAEAWEPLDYILKDENQKISLATVCRRIEVYRRRNGLLSIYYICGHCHALVSLHDLYTRDHLDLDTIFGRRLCSALADDSKNNIVYVCTKCSKECRDGCEPVSTKQPEVDQRIYYTPPGYDRRNWGGPSDWGMYNSVHWPRTSQVQQTYVATMESIEWTESDLQDLVYSALAEAVKEDKLSSILADKERAAAAGSRLRNVGKNWADQLARELKVDPPSHTEKNIQFSPEEAWADIKDLVDTDKVCIRIPANVRIKDQEKPSQQSRPRKRRRRRM